MSNGIERIDHGELADISLDDEPIGHTYPRPSSTPEPEKGILEKIYRVFSNSITALASSLARFWNFITGENSNDLTISLLREDFKCKRNQTVDSKFTCPT